jgi:hypothetical protein
MTTKKAKPPSKKTPKLSWKQVKGEKKANLAPDMFMKFNA